MKISLGKGMFWSKLRKKPLENLLARPHKEFVDARIPLLLKINKPMYFEKLSSD